MKLYKTTGGEKLQTVWSGSLAEASKARVAMKKEKLAEVGTEVVDVPTNKEALLGWLNANAA